MEGPGSGSPNNHTKKRLLQFTVKLPNFESSESSDSKKLNYKEKDLTLPWGHEPIYFGDQLIGHATSSGWSFTLDQGVFLGHVYHEDAYKKGWWNGKSSDQKFMIELFGQKYEAKAFLPNKPCVDPSGDRVKGIKVEGIQQPASAATSGATAGAKAGM